MALSERPGLHPLISVSTRRPAFTRMRACCVRLSSFYVCDCFTDYCRPKRITACILSTTLQSIRVLGSGFAGDAMMTDGSPVRDATAALSPRREVVRYRRGARSAVLPPWRPDGTAATCMPMFRPCRRRDCSMPPVSGHALLITESKPASRYRRDAGPFTHATT